MKRILKGLLIFLIFSSLKIQAQSPDDLHISDHVVIENVMLTQKAGLSPKKVSIIIRKGIIENITSSTNYPKDAVIISADSLYAYPAFIDAGSHTAYPKVDKKEKPKEVKNPGNPGYERAGISPEATVHDYLKLDDGSVEKMRNAGFAVSHVLPRGRMLSGQGSIILLNNEETIPYIKKNTSMYGSFQPAQGRVFPSTVIAVMTKHRELFKQAEYAKKYELQYSNNPVGLDRPAYPEQIQALYPVIDKSQALYFKAEKSLDVSRALALNKDLKSKLILTEVKQIGSNLDKIKTSGSPILLSLDLPENMKEEKDSTKVITEKQQNLIDRKKEAIKAYQMLAVECKKNNIPFSFSNLESKPGDLNKKVKILLESGMSKEDVLRALTWDAAEILGISNVTGSVEANKLANIVITDGELFEKESNIVYTIVEGKMYKQEVKKKKKIKGDKDAKVEIAGTWEILAKIPGEEQNAKVKFEKSDDEYTGVLIDDEGEEYPLKNIELNGDVLSFTLTIVQQGMNLEMDTSAQITEDTMEGTISIANFGSFPLEGSKLSNPEK
jgi:hypothetical protein